jgi:hypothetical protein
MTAVPFMIALAVATLVFFVVANLRATRDVLSAGVLLRFYLYIASFVTLVVLVSGLTYLVTGLFSLGSIDFSYARFIRPEPIPQVASKDAPDSAARFDQEQIERQRDQQSTDLIRGGTLAVMGATLFAVHAVLRRRGAPDEAAEGNFRRGFLVVGLVTFGLVGLVALPVGVYQALKFFLITPLPTQTRLAPGNTLATGLVLTPLWIYYLVALTRQARPGGIATSA